MRLTREFRLRLSPRASDYDAPKTNSWSGWPATREILPQIPVRITVDAPVDEVSGFICNIAEIDVALMRVTRELGPPALVGVDAPRLLQQLWSVLKKTDLPLAALEIAVSPYLRFSTSEKSPAMVCMTQQFEFSASHRLHCEQFSAEKNVAVFGKCNNENGHGHNYVLDVTIQGEPDPQTGAILGVGEVDAKVKSLVIDKFDHRHLNADLAEFATLNPTVENIAIVIWRILADEFNPANLQSIRLYETPKTWVEIDANTAGTGQD